MSRCVIHAPYRWWLRLQVWVILLSPADPSGTLEGSGFWRGAGDFVGLDFSDFTVIFAGQ